MLISKATSRFSLASSSSRRFDGVPTFRVMVSVFFCFCGDAADLRRVFCRLTPLDDDDDGGDRPSCWLTSFRGIFWVLAMPRCLLRCSARSSMRCVINGVALLFCLHEFQGHAKYIYLGERIHVCCWVLTLFLSLLEGTQLKSLIEQRAQFKGYQRIHTDRPCLVWFTFLRGPSRRNILGRNANKQKKKQPVALNFSARLRLVLLLVCVWKSDVYAKPETTLFWINKLRSLRIAQKGPLLVSTRW